MNMIEENSIVLQRTDIKDIVINSFEDMQRMAKMFAASELVPDHLKGKPNSVLIILQTAKELGIGPLQAIDGVDVIKGKRGIKPEFQIALIRSRVPEAFIKFTESYDKQEVSCTMAPSREKMDESFTSTWNVKRATDMGLINNDNYKKQKMTMFKWRAAGDAARTVFPHITKGLYNTFETEDLLQSSPPRKTLKEIFGNIVGHESMETDEEIALPPPDSGLVIETSSKPAATKAKTFDQVNDPIELNQ